MRTASIQALATVLVLAMLGTTSPAAAEPFLEAYMGKSFTLASDIRLRQPGLGNEFTVEEVSFDDESFSGPPHWGWRAGYFFEQYPSFGVALEYLHFKVIAETSELKRLRGILRGSPIDTTARVDSIVQQFQITHGVNYVTLDALFRYPLLQDPERLRHGRVQLYGGLGIGPVIVHAENRIEQLKNDKGYEVTGPGVQAFAGARALLFKHFGVFAEYKFTHSRLHVGVASGDGRLTEDTHHIIWGVTIALPSF